MNRPEAVKVRYALSFLKRSSLIRNSGFLILATIVSALVGYLYWVLIARGATPQQVGFAAAGIAAFTLTALLANLGIAPVLIRTLPTLADRHAWSSFLTVGMTLTAMSSAAVTLIVGLLLPNISHNFVELRQPAFLLLMVLGGGLSTITVALDASFVACRHSEHVVFRSAISGIAKLALILVAVALPLRLTPLEIVFSWDMGLGISIAIGTAVLLPRVMTEFRLRFSHGVAPLLARWRMFAGNHLTNLGGVIVPYLLPVLVVARISRGANAYFYLTWSVASIFMIVSPAVSAALFAEGSNDGNVLVHARHSLVVTAALLTPAIVVSVVAGHFILSLFGPEYSKHGYVLLVVLALASIPDAITNIADSVLRVRDRLGMTSALNLSIAAIAVVLSWVLLGHLGIVGAGIAWLVAQSVGAAGVGVVSLVHVHNRRSLAASTPPFGPELSGSSRIAEQ